VGDFDQWLERNLFTLIFWGAIILIAVYFVTH